MLMDSVKFEIFSLSFTKDDLIGSRVLGWAGMSFSFRIYRLLYSFFHYSFEKSIILMGCYFSLADFRISLCCTLMSSTMQQIVKISGYFKLGSYMLLYLNIRMFYKFNKISGIILLNRFLLYINCYFEIKFFKFMVYSKA